MSGPKYLRHVEGFTRSYYSHDVLRMLYEVERFSNEIIENDHEDIFDILYAPQIEFVLQQMMQLIASKRLFLDIHLETITTFLLALKSLCNLQGENVYRPLNTEHFLPTLIDTLTWSMEIKNPELFQVTCQVFISLSHGYAEPNVRALVLLARENILDIIAIADEEEEELYWNHDCFYSAVSMRDEEDEIIFRKNGLKLIETTAPIEYLPSDFNSLPWNKQEVYITLLQQNYDDDQIPIMSANVQKIQSLLENIETHPLVKCACLYKLQQFIKADNFISRKEGLEIARTLLTCDDNRVKFTALYLYLKLCQDTIERSTHNYYTSIYSDLLFAIDYAKDYLAYEIVNKYVYDELVDLLFDGVSLLLLIHPNSGIRLICMRYLLDIMKLMFEANIVFPFKNQLFNTIKKLLAIMSLEESVEYLPLISETAINHLDEITKLDPYLMGAVFTADLLGDIIAKIHPQSIDKYFSSTSIVQLRKMVERSLEHEDMIRKNAQLYVTYTLFSKLSYSDLCLLMKLKDDQVGDFVLKELYGNSKIDLHIVGMNRESRTVEAIYRMMSQLIAQVIQPSERLTSRVLEDRDIWAAIIASQIAHEMDMNSHLDLALFSSRFCMLSPCNTNTIYYFVNTCGMMARALETECNPNDPEFEEILDALYYMTDAVALEYGRSGVRRNGGLVRRSRSDAY